MSYIMNSVILGLIFILPFCERVSALIPHECAGNLTETSAVCCPTPETDEKQPCGFPYRGICREIQVYKPYPESTKIFQSDLRYLWPTKIFSYACECRGNFYGPACQQCRYGWTGPDCKQRVIRTRRNIFSYTAAEKKLFRDVLVKTRELDSDYVIINERYYRDDQLTWKRANIHEMLVFVHFFTSKSGITSDPDACEDATIDCNHGGAGFLTWHRHFMLLWERLARRIARKYFNVKDFTFPYWDWTDRKECEVCVNELVGAEGRPTSSGNRISSESAFHDWTAYCSDSSDPDVTGCIPCHMGDKNVPLTRSWQTSHYPQLRYVEAALKKSYYYDFPRVDVEEYDTSCQYFEAFLEGSCALSGESKDEKGYLFLHNRLHNICNGTFQRPQTSVNDPIFVFHHLQIDRIFQKWFAQTQPHSSQLPNLSFETGHCRDCNLVGIFPPVPHRDFFVDVRALGYVYDNYNFVPPKTKEAEKDVDTDLTPLHKKKLKKRDYNTGYGSD